MFVVLFLNVLIQAVFSIESTCDLALIQRQIPGSIKGKIITIATLNDNAPFISHTHYGVPEGFNVELMTLIASVTNLDFRYEYRTPSELISQVQENPHVISISSQTITSALIKLVDFAQFFQTGSDFLVKSSYSETINGLRNLCGKKVVVISGSTQQIDMLKQSKKCGKKKINIVTVNDKTRLVNNILNGIADVAVYNEVEIKYAVSKSNGALKSVGIPYNIRPIGIVCNKNLPSLCTTLVSAINLLINNGSYEELLNDYGFSFSENGVCPSKINLTGKTGIASCVPSAAFCKQASE